MNEKDYEILMKLKDYFDSKCKNLIFSNEMRLKNDKRAIMYYVKVDTTTEKNNYKKIFQEYISLYVHSLEKLRYFKFDENNISDKLIEYGKKTWNDDGLITKGDLNKSGIFGELFNDFYLNIVRNENILLTYSSRRGFSEKNVKGVDVVGCTEQNNQLILIFSESKFVNSASAAYTALRDDINGKETEKSHISSEYINKFSYYIIDKGHSFYDDSTNNIKFINETINKISDELLNSDSESAIDIYNKLNVKIRFVFFAIYKDKIFTPEERQKYYMGIIADFNNNILDTGLKEYEINVVFIPIINESTTIKEYMVRW